MNNKVCTLFKKKEDNDLVINNITPHKYFYDYHPYRHNTNPEWNKPTDGKILDVKEGKERGINHFTPLLEDILSRNDYVICVIPSHEVGTKPSGIRSIAERLCIHPVIDGTKVLYRIIEVPKKTDGGNRDFDLEYRSLEVQNEKLIRNKQVLLLDDVSTSGVSLNAGKKVLEEAGADLVFQFALGKTVP